ncbi:hypothetical protein LCGC14_2616930, partial [marine sediment metagenome]
MTDEEKYIAGQKACGIEVGDTVRILRRADRDENYWANEWMRSMDDKIGETVTVSGMDALGVMFEDVPYSYPYS